MVHMRVVQTKRRHCAFRSFVRRRLSTRRSWQHCESRTCRRSQCSGVLRAALAYPSHPRVLLLRPLATHHGASFKCRDLYTRAVAAGGHPCGSAAVWRAVVRVGICADDVVVVDVGVRERVCRGTNPTSPAPLPPPSSHALHPHPAPCWMLSWPRRSRTRI